MKKLFGDWKHPAVRLFLICAAVLWLLSTIALPHFIGCAEEKKLERTMERCKNFRSEIYELEK